MLHNVARLCIKTNSLCIRPLDADMDRQPDTVQWVWWKFDGVVGSGSLFDCPRALQINDAGSQ